MNCTFGKHEALYIFTIRVVIPGILGAVAIQKQALILHLRDLLSPERAATARWLADRSRSGAFA